MYNFNTECLNIADAVKQIEIQVENLKEDLTRLKKNPKATENLIFFKTQQIKVMLNSINCITESQLLTTEIYKNQQKEINNLKTEKFKLIGICLYHGISNINFYLRMPINQIIETVKIAFTEGWRQTPFQLMENTKKDDLFFMRRLIKNIDKLKNTNNGKN